VSPALPPLILKAKYGFFAIEGPHWADITSLSLRRAVTSWMNQAGTIAPAESRRWPVSISWFIRMRTSVIPSLAAARMRIGFAMACLPSDLVAGARLSRRSRPA